MSRKKYNASLILSNILKKYLMSKILDLRLDNSNPSKDEGFMLKSSLRNFIIGRCDSSSGSFIRKVSELDTYLTTILIDCLPDGPDFDILQ